MRKLREQAGPFILFAVSVLCISIGFKLYIKKIHSPSNPKEVTHLTPESIVPRKLVAQEKKVQEFLNRQIANQDVNESLEGAEADEEVPPGRQFRKISEESKAPFGEFLFSDNYAGKYHTDQHEVCNRLEYRGDGPVYTHVAREDWRKVLDQFHEAKSRLYNWLELSRAGLPEKTVTFMKEQVTKAVLLSPPLIDEPDLNWRGLGIWGRGVSGAPLIRVSSGFIRLVLQQPKRAQFEMTRLVAQGWAPCEFQRSEMLTPWLDLLRCLEIPEELSCDAGSYSEGGWAISTSLAMKLSPPGCFPPVFLNPMKNQCLQTLQKTRKEGHAG